MMIKKNLDTLKEIGETIAILGLISIVVFGVIRLFFWQSSAQVKMNVIMIASLIVAWQSHPSPVFYGIIKMTTPALVNINIFIISIISAAAITVLNFFY